jgi:hypothetical protein
LISPTKIVAGILALSAFAVAAIAGLGVGNSAEVTLMRAMLAMFICYFAGLPLGKICEHVIQEHITLYITNHPVKSPTATGGDANSGKPESETKVEEKPAVV